MRTVNFKGIELPILGMGTWHMGDNPTLANQEIETLRYGLDHGINVIDTAELYGNGNSERLVGQVIKPYDRERLFLIDKVLPTNASKKGMQRSINASLKRLGTDYVDLYLLHWRGNVPLAETIEGFEGLKAEGKIKEWGISNFDVVDLVELYQLAKGKNAFANEILYHLGSRGVEYDLLPWQEKHDLGTIAYSPIAQGDTLGHQLHNNPILQAIGAKHQVSVIQLMLAWVLHQHHVMAIPQTSRVSHMAENIDAANLVLSKEELAEIEETFPKPTGKRQLDVL